jgi:hypothetical protein
LRALQYGEISVCTDEEISLAGAFSEITLVRAWNYWRSRATDR